MMTKWRKGMTTKRRVEVKANEMEVYVATVSETVRRPHHQLPLCLHRDLPLRPLDACDDGDGDENGIQKKKIPVFAFPFVGW